MRSKAYTNEHTSYTVVFDNGSTHICKTVRDALEFAEHMAGVGIYGDPVEVYEVHRVSTVEYSTVHEF